MNRDYDVLIIGGGLVGATLACALGKQDLRIGLVEAYPFQSSQQPSYDDRSVALAYGSRRILEGIGLWPALAQQATPIHRIHISDRGHFGFARLDRRDGGYEALGYVIENRIIGNVFAAAIAQQKNIELLCPATLLSLKTSAQQAQITLQTEGEAASSQQPLSAHLIIGADGSQSAVRQLCHIDSRCWDYGQSAIIANISTEKPHNNLAYERFTNSGPLALLPLSEQRCSLVWSVRNEDLDELLALSDEDFLTRLQKYFGHRLGTLKRCGQRNSYPLQLIRARQHDTPRVALIGNAAHTLHPIAGQGFNLGIRDIAALAEVICDAQRQGKDIGSAHVLKQYEQWRRHDQRHVTALTDGLVRIFSNDFKPLVIARNAALLAMGLLPPLKRRLARHSMGLGGRLPRLSRGLPL